jgi:hypothetical protein
MKHTPENSSRNIGLQKYREIQSHDTHLELEEGCA